ncbi:MAG: nicotinate phosphoribosyltransferase [bacterium]|nr:nicotinate phosphoribosyltransferase [bacterium]
MKRADRRVAEGLLLTDQYHLTSAQIYYRLGLTEQRVQFDYFFRRYPNYGDHQAGFCVFAGFEWLLDWMEEARAGERELEFLRGQKTSAGERLFEDGFLDWLRNEGDFSSISIEAVPEGRVVHANVPLVVVRGPMAMAQVLETPLLNHLNYQTLIATKAARVRAAGRGRPLLEFGLRRAPERGASAGTRAALIGGADFSSNVGVSHLLGFQPKGTHAHGLVQLFMALGEGELGAFRAFAESYPDDCLLLVDTVDTLESGVPNAIRVFEELRRKGHRPVGIRLDSGDLAYLAIRSAVMLDTAGFEDAVITLSSGLDELAIWQILTQIEEEAPRYGVDADALINRLVYGVGTRLVTSGSDNIDGVYKAAAVELDGSWQPLLKVSESPAKTVNPGDKRLWRVYDRRDTATVDVLALASENVVEAGRLELHHPIREDLTRTLMACEISSVEPLLADAVRDGEPVGPPPSIEEMRARRQRDLSRLDPGVRRLVNPHVYHVSLTRELWELKQNLVTEATRGA